MSAIQEFVQKHPVKKFDKDQLILIQDEKPDVLYVVKTGFVKGYDITSQGTEQLVWFGAKNDIFPLGWLFSITSKIHYFYGAFSDVELYVVPRQEFRDFLNDNAKAGLELCEQLADRYFDLLRRLNAVEKPKANEKIAHTLLFIAARYQKSTDKNAVEISLPLTHQDIANLVGLTRETTAIELKKLKDAGCIFYDKWHFTVYRDKLTDYVS